MTDSTYKTALFSVLEYLAHMETPDVSQHLFAHLELLEHLATRDAAPEAVRAFQEARTHLSLHQARRLLDLASGRDGAPPAS